MVAQPVVGRIVEGADDRENSWCSSRGFPASAIAPLHDHSMSGRSGNLESWEHQRREDSVPRQWFLQWELGHWTR